MRDFLLARVRCRPVTLARHNAMDAHPSKRTKWPGFQAEPVGSRWSGFQAEQVPGSRFQVEQVHVGDPSSDSQRHSGLPNGSVLLLAIWKHLGGCCEAVRLILNHEKQPWRGKDWSAAHLFSQSCSLLVAWQTPARVWIQVQLGAKLDFQATHMRLVVVDKHWRPRSYGFLPLPTFKLDKLFHSHATHTLIVECFQLPTLKNLNPTSLS